MGVGGMSVMSVKRRGVADRGRILEVRNINIGSHCSEIFHYVNSLLDAEFLRRPP